MNLAPSKDSLKISMAELQRLMRDPDIPESQLRAYFTAYPEASRPFAPAFVPNPERVDVAPPADELEGATMTDWANNLSRQRRQSKFKKRREGGDKSPVLVSEGDSWFQFPILLEDVIDQLFRDFNIWSVDAAGDTLQNMVLDQPEYMEALESQAGNVRAFLFSGAGNDFLGEDSSGQSVLLQILRPFKAGKPADWYIETDAFARKLNFVEDCYRKVLSTVEAKYPGLPVICHGYDYAIPGGGPGDKRHPIYAAQDKWLGRPMREDLGIADPGLQRAIVKLLIDKLNGALASLCGGNRAGGSFKNAWHVDARCTVGTLAFWADELHPTDQGFAQVADKFRSVLGRAIPGLEAALAPVLGARADVLEDAVSASTAYARRLVAIANAEFESFHEITESDEPLRSRINQYCREIGIAEPDDISDFAWSATFVSWCVKTAGATAAEFKFNPTHAVFVKAAIANADANKGVFRARPIDEYRPKVGDIIHRNRNNGSITYKQARIRSNYPSHSAIVVEIGSAHGARFARTIGGNESDSIRATKVPLTSDGFVAQRDSNPFICVIENLKVEAPPAVLKETVTVTSQPATYVCEASGETEQILEAAVSKPHVDRVELTDHKSSRDGTEIDHIVIHYTTSRNIEGTISHFKHGSPEVSAHYIVGRDGELVQMVPDAERAWHAGKSDMNARSIGIEHVAAAGDAITPEQARTSLALIRWLMQEYGISIDHVIPHVCVKPTSCCGDLFKEFGGGANKPCSVQKAALDKWLNANGIEASSEEATLVSRLEAGPEVDSAPPSSQIRARMELADDLTVAAGDDVDFISTGAGKRPFDDIGSDSPIDNPEKMLKGWRAYRNGIQPEEFEAIVEKDTSLPATFLQLMAEQRQAVGRILASGTNYRGERGRWAGTGFLVGKNILLTNHHVLNSAEVAQGATVNFNYEISPSELVAGKQEPASQPGGRSYRFNPSRLFLTSPATDGGLDFTFVWIETDSEAPANPIPMRRSAFSIANSEQAFVIHHPEGHGKRVSIDDVDVVEINTTVVRYVSDTMPGSSGSPVFDRQGRLFGLHHAGKSGNFKRPDGRAVDVLNEGIKIGAIALDLERRRATSERSMAEMVLSLVQGSDTMAGFFGNLGRATRIPSDATGVEAVVDSYRGSDADVDIGFWNIEWLANRYHDATKLREAAALITDLGLDIWGLEEVSPPAVQALVQELDRNFGEKYDFALSEPNAPESRQSTAMIWKTKTVNGNKEAWPDEIERYWHLSSTDDLGGLEAVEGKIFDRYPGLFKFSIKGRGNPFEFHVIPLHLKAMAEGSKRRQLASQLLARAVRLMTQKYHKGDDWILGGDFNAELATNDFKRLLSADLKPMSAADEQAGAFSYVKSPRSLIDHIFLSPNLVRRTDGDAYFIVAKDKSVDNYAAKLSDHRPVLVRLSIGSRSRGDELAIDIDSQIEKLLARQATSGRSNRRS